MISSFFGERILLNKSKIVGVLGGMGPFATAAFYRKILELTPATKDWEHLRIIIDSNPHIPSRSRHVLYGEESPVAGMIENCRQLAEYPVDFIVIPCNSACFFIHQIQPEVSVPILNIMDVTAAALAQRFSGDVKVAVCGSAVTYRGRTYEAFLQKRGLTYLHHDQDCQAEIEAIIELLKLDIRTVTTVDRFRGVAERLRNYYGAGAIILGCTEFGCLTDIQCGTPLIDSSLELARYVVDYARS